MRVTDSNVVISRHIGLSLVHLLAVTLSLGISFSRESGAMATLMMSSSTSVMLGGGASGLSVRVVLKGSFVNSCPRTSPSVVISSV